MSIPGTIFSTSQNEFRKTYKALNLTKEEVRLAVEKATSAEGLYASLVAEDYSV
jgi:hypothetical protein